MCFIYCRKQTTYSFTERTLAPFGESIFAVRYGVKWDYAKCLKTQDRKSIYKELRSCQKTTTFFVKNQSFFLQTNAAAIAIITTAAPPTTDAHPLSSSAGAAVVVALVSGALVSGAFVSGAWVSVLSGV